MAGVIRNTSLHFTFLFILRFMPQVNAVNCNTSWKIALFMKFSDYREDVLKGVCYFVLYLLIRSAYSVQVSVAEI